MIRSGIIALRFTAPVDLSRREVVRDPLAQAQSGSRVGIAALQRDGRGC
jgi:hypothetical protein